MCRLAVCLYGVSAAFVVLLLLGCERQKTVPETEPQEPAAGVGEDRTDRSEPPPQLLPTQEDGKAAADAPEPPDTGVDAAAKDDGESVRPAETEAARVDVVITFGEPVYVSMPVWVNIRCTTTGRDFPIQENVRYPFSTTPWHFGLYEFDVRRGDKPHPRIHIPPALQMGEPGSSLVGGSCAPPTSPKYRLPLHLQYRFEGPGTYYVKFRAYSPSFPKREVAAQSAWTKLDVMPFSDQQRRTWLRQKKANPPQDVGLLVGDYLPSILAHPNDDVLGILLSHVHHPDGLVESFALYSLAYYGEEVFRREIPRLVKEKGATDLLAHVLSWRRDLFQEQGEQIVDSIIPFLDSRSARAVEGAVKALYFIRAHYSWEKHPDVPSRIEEAVLSTVGHVKSFEGREPLHALCLFLGTVKSDRARTLLWELSANDLVREQALICMTWIGDARDLPKLAPFLLEDVNSVRFLSGLLRRAYGREAYRREAIPWLEKGLQGSPSWGMRVACARQLALEDSPKAFAFFREALAGDSPHFEGNIIGFLEDHCGLARGSRLDEVLAFIDSKIRELGDDQKP